jgi:hypothetical protein
MPRARPFCTFPPFFSSCTYFISFNKNLLSGPPLQFLAQKKKNLERKEQQGFLVGVQAVKHPTGKYKG